MSRDPWGGTRKAALAALVTSWAIAAFAQQAQPTVERILTPALAEKQHLTTLAPSVAVTPNGVAVVGDGDRVWAVGADGAVQIAGIRNANSFAMSPEGLLVIVSGKSLLYLDPVSKTLKPVFDLPFAGMNLVSESRDSFLLYGPDGTKGCALYELLPGRKVMKIVDTPRPITGVARMGDEILLVTGGALFAVSQNTMVLLAGEIGGKLHSVAVDEGTGHIFLSDGHSLFAIQQGAVVALTGGLGGELRWQSGGLIVFNPTQRSLARLVNLTPTEPAR